MLAQTLAIAALAVGVAGGGPTPPPELGDAQLVGQRLVTGFDGERVPAALRRRISAGRLAGVILFDSNFDSRAEAERLVGELQAIRRPRALRDPLLVMIDQEGGLVKRLPGPPSLSAEEMGAAGRSTCRRQGRATGDLLRQTAINVDLAPVLDVARPGSVMDVEDRAFGSDPGLVAGCGGAFAAALSRAGVVPTAKHFPGLGAAALNTDSAVQRISLSKSRLRRVDELPYRRFIDRSGGRGRMVMLSSAVYPAFSDRPAAFSRSLATVELRRRLGFRGVSITDALETASTDAFGGPTRAARLAARAGTDLLLFANLEAAEQAAKALRPQVRGGSRERFVESIGRVLELRAHLRRPGSTATGRFRSHPKRFRPVGD
jgi:beta-N-acetylhexosaminidase